jgi:hypothetical protein
MRIQFVGTGCLFAAIALDFYHQAPTVGWPSGFEPMIRSEKLIFWTLFPGSQPSSTKWPRQIPFAVPGIWAYFCLVLGLRIERIDLLSSRSGISRRTQPRDARDFPQSLKVTIRSHMTVLGPRSLRDIRAFPP